MCEKRHKITYTQSVLLDQSAVALLNLLAHVHQLDSRLDDALRVVAHLSVHLGSMTHIFVQSRVQALLLPTNRTKQIIS